MGRAVRLVETRADGAERSLDVLELGELRGLGDIADLGLTLAEARQLLSRVQQAVIAAQTQNHAVHRPTCSACGGRCHVKDRRLRHVATLFGSTSVCLPRFRCADCGHCEAGLRWPSHCRSAPELDTLRAHLSALLPYRVAADVLGHLLPVEAGMHHETLRSHTLKAGEQLPDAASEAPPAKGAAAITVSLDSTFVRSCHDGERHFEVRVGNVETAERGRQVVGAVAGTDTELVPTIAGA